MSEPGTPPVDYDSPKDLAALMERLGFAMQKRFGQNFLINKPARRKILGLLEAQQGERLWEVGPGTGSMTWEAASLGHPLSVFEIDRGFAEFLRQSYGSLDGFALFEGDFVKTWSQAAKEYGKPTRVFGNLPYNAAGAIIAAIIEGGLRPQRMVFTVQKEAAQRMAAMPGTKNYAAFTVLCQSAYTVRHAFDLSPGVFWPQPRVTSSVVVMDARADALPCAGEQSFTRFTRCMFASRRKTLRNNLRAAGYTPQDQDAAAEKTGLSLDLRAEALSPQQLAALFAGLQTPV
ncbi:MAG TPA: 16S rRNA (adenine(1518)-N(6)/adenine(1519)-N(6))-dimethyltransferase RsmA [Spirochaetales bacterium]|nr:16S rRNA (adenine(1518)-N(6)/adenine(1519)-N(6))-dimethyltransferase RsmA [Spirochaetales bacterium]